MPTDDNRSISEILDSLKQMKLNKLDKMLALVDQIMEKQDKLDSAFSSFISGSRTRRSYAATHRNLERSMNKLEREATDQLWRLRREISDEDWGEIRAKIEGYGYDKEAREAIVIARENVVPI